MLMASLGSDNTPCKVPCVLFNFSEEWGEEQDVRQGSSQAVPDLMCASGYSEDNQKAQCRLYKRGVSTMWYDCMTWTFMWQTEVIKTSTSVKMRG